MDLGLRELWRFRHLALVLATRGLKARYRQTVVGIAWVLIQPLVLMLIFSFFWALLFPSNAMLSGVPRPVFFLSVLSMWTPAMKVVNEGTMSVLVNSALVTRVYMPRATFPISVAIASLVDLAFTLLALLIVLLFYGYLPIATWLVLPVLIVVSYATALGVSLALGALNTTYRDVQVILPFLVQVWMFSSPIIYPASLVPEPFSYIYYLNPMALVCTGARWALVGTPAPPDYAWILGSVMSLLLLAGGYLLFRRREPNFSDVL